MSAEPVGRHMPAVMTLDDLTAMMVADEHHHRYEISPEGVLSVMPPPGYAHAIIATRLTVWLAAAGMPTDRIAQAVGLRIPGRTGGEGGRIPDLILWSKAQADGVWLSVSDVLLVVEIISPGSEGMDAVTKRREYAAAGIPQCWTVDQDPAQTVTITGSTATTTRRGRPCPSPGRSTPHHLNTTSLDIEHGSCQSHVETALRRICRCRSRPGEQLP